MRQYPSFVSTGVKHSVDLSRLSRYWRMPSIRSELVDSRDFGRADGRALDGQSYELSARLLIDGSTSSAGLPLTTETVMNALH